MSLTVVKWIERYSLAVQARHASGEIKAKTVQDYIRLARFCCRVWGDRQLMSISAYEISRIINEKAQETPYAARRLRINLSDLFKEAQRAGVVPMGHNPALLSRPPITAVAAARLSLSEWIKIFKCAKYRTPVYFQNAMLLALVTGQRSSDLVRMHSRDVRDGYLYITQFKTGERIALPLSLRLDAVSTSLAEVIDICPSNGLMLQTDSGKRINTWSLSQWFRVCRECCELSVPPGCTAPPFREQRSLAERLYRVQGIDTRTLLGHKYQRMTDKYNDLRGKDFRYLTLS